MNDVVLVSSILHRQTCARNNKTHHVRTLNMTKKNVHMRKSKHFCSKLMKRVNKKLKKRNKKSAVAGRYLSSVVASDCE